MSLKDATTADNADSYHILGAEDFNPVMLENEAQQLQSPSATPFQPELPPIHLAAAQGDLDRIMHLVSEEERIFTSVSSVWIFLLSSNLSEINFSCTEGFCKASALILRNCTWPQRGCRVSRWVAFGGQGFVQMSKKL